MNIYERIFTLLLEETQVQGARVSAGSSGKRTALGKNTAKRERRRLARRGQYGWRKGTPKDIHVGPDPEPQ